MRRNRRILIIIAAFFAFAIAGGVFLLPERAISGPPKSRETQAAELAEARLLDRAVTAIERNYFDPARINPRKMLQGAQGRLQRTIPEILIRDGDEGTMTVTVGLASKRIRRGTLSSLGEMRDVLREVLAFIAANYSGETEPNDIEYSAIDGLLEPLDPHSNFMSPKAYNEFQVGTRGEFGGLGIVISLKDGWLTVVAPIEDTPAARVGILAGDRILQINDESTINMSLTDAVNKLRGEVGTKVAVVVERAGKPPRKFLLTRALINIDSVKHRLLAEDGKRIGYLKVKSFQQNTDDDVKAALTDFKQGGKLDGIILDLRNNPGGLLNVAVDLADHFLKEGVIVSTVGPRDQVLEREVAHGEGTEDKVPMIVLVNEGSASASEIVAGALQASNRALVMGRRSFGKGSVQTVIELGSGTALKLTIAQYKPAGTQSIQLVGLTPDVELDPVTVDRESMNLVEDVIASEMDLEEHLEGARAQGESSKIRPVYTVRFVKPKESEKDLEARSVREYAKEPEIEKDFAVTLARRALAEGGLATRMETLSSISTVVARAQEAQDAATDAALKAIGIDWSKAKADGSPSLKVAYHLQSPKGGEVARARAGEKVELELSATNVGSGPYSRLTAVGQSDMPFLANREFVFGAIAPGVTRSWKVPIELPEGLPRQDLRMDVTFVEANGRTPQPMSVIIPVEELPEPSFAFSYKTGAAAGRPFAAGASIPLDVEVTNAGAGATSKDTAATISNECNEKIFIEQGRAKLDAIAPKASRRAAFRFHMTGTPDDGCSIKLGIADLKRNLAVTKKIGVDAKAGAMKPPAGPRYAPPTIEVETAPTSTADSTIRIKGMIRDADPVRDYFVFVGEKKTTYVSNAQNTTSMAIDVTVPLEPGSNTILIGARDREELMGRKIIVVDRTSGERKKARPFAMPPDMLP